MRGSLISLVLGIVVICANAQFFSIDLAQPTKPFPHFWEECVGSGHAELGLRADWRAHLTRVHSELGFKSVRFHGLFDDDMSALLGIEKGVPIFSWFNINSVFDFLVSIGMRPYVELSFMPEILANGTTTTMHYKGYTSGPKNWTIWEQFISAFATNIIDRYGWDEISQWSFEVWNEPNCGFFNGNQQQYFTLYQRTALALKKVNSGLRVGGPITCQSAWLPEFIDFCTKNNVPYDFIATHEYPTDINPPNKDSMREVFAKARTQVGNNTRLYYSEFNDGLYANPSHHDEPFAASYIFYLLHRVQGLVDLLSWWTFTDIFEEPGQTSIPFGSNDGWGLLNIYNIPKPSYRAFQLLHTFGTAEVPTVANNSTTRSSVDVYSVLSPDSSTLHVVISNYNVPTSNIASENVTVWLTNLKVTPSTGVLYRIDEDNSNPARLWVKMGSPTYPTPVQINQLAAASELQPEKLDATPISKNAVQFRLVVPAFGSAVISVPLK